MHCPRKYDTCMYTTQTCIPRENAMVTKYCNCLLIHVTVSTDVDSYETETLHSF